MQLNLHNDFFLTMERERKDSDWEHRIELHDPRSRVSKETSTSFPRLAYNVRGSNGCIEIVKGDESQALVSVRRIKKKEHSWQDAFSGVGRHRCKVAIEGT